MIKQNPLAQLTAIIIDDESDAGNLLKNLLSDFSAIHVKHVFTDALKALDIVIMEQPPVIFLDIEMPEITGLEFLQQVNKFSPNTLVVIVSAYKNYALEAIQNDAFDFITKPIAKVDLRRVVHKVVATINKASELIVHEPIQRLLLKTTEGHHYVSLDNILYLEADGNYTKVNTKDGNKLLSSLNLGRVFEKLPPTVFVRISRKHIINKNYMTFMNFCKKHCILSNNGEEHKLEVSLKLKDLKQQLQND